MFKFKECTPVPVEGGQGVIYGCGGVVEVEGRVVWACRSGEVYWWDEEDKYKWKRMTDGVEIMGSVAVCGGRLVCIGDWKDGVCSKKVKVWGGGRWSLMSDMLVGCEWSCPLGIGGGDMVVMGGYDGVRRLNDVRVFDGKTQTWHKGPPLPQQCHSMSAVVHGDQIFVMGGWGMDRAVAPNHCTSLVSNTLCYFVMLVNSQCTCSSGLSPVFHAVQT